MSRRLSVFLSMGLPIATVLRASAAETPAKVSVFFENHCNDCHDSDTKKGNLDLTTLKPDFADAETFARWLKVHDRVRAGEMPPKKANQPSAAERNTVLKALAAGLSAADTQRQRESGRVALRRLNRAEYESTIRDLFALPGLQVRDMLPEDGRLDGFDKASAALDISAVQLGKYLEAADFVLDAAIAHQDKPMVWKQRFRRIGGLAQFGECSFPIKNGKADMELLKEMARKREDGKSMRLQEKEPLLQTMDSLGFITHARESWRPDVETFSPFHSGFYRMQTSVWSYDYNRGHLAPTQRMQSLALSAGGRLLAYFDAPSLKPQNHDIVVWLNAGETLELNAANLWANYNNVFNYEGPGVAVDYVDVEGPLHDTWPPESHRRLFGKLPIAELNVRKDRSPSETYPRQPAPIPRPPGARPHHNDGNEYRKWQPVWTVAAPRPAEDCEQLLNDFLPRAFRRPVPPDEVAVHVRIARERIAAGDFFESAMRAAYRVALCSPDFLFLQEPPADLKDPTRIDGYALASRLSYFLWNSMPDEELLKHAEKRTLNGLLAQQADRLLADRKSDRFIEDFLNQWVELRKIDFTSPDQKLYPEFRPDLRDAMLAETRAFFREMLTQNLSISHLIDSDFLTINQRLAEHYGISGVEGSAIRRVPRPAGSPRGGLLTHGAILKVSANGTTTSPVLRGAWVINHILGWPLQPPPPDVPAVDPDIRGTTTIREQLDKHRHDPACAACHANIDPPGFALENFDVIGGWRTQYRFVGEKVDDPSQRRGNDPAKALFLGVGVKQWEHVLNNVRLGLPVDAAGNTPDGEVFSDIHDFKRILLARQENIARGFVERLILYATGAPVSFADRAQVDAILRKSQPDGYGMRTLVRELILNPFIFQRK